MAKNKRSKKDRKRDHTPDKPQPKTNPPLTKIVPEVKQQVLKIDKHKREVLHEIWPELLMHSVSQAESAIFRSYGTYKAGLTPNEAEELKKIRAELNDVHQRLSLIYFRLKFWS